MPSVGERLRASREAGRTTIDEMAAATVIGHSFLEALERDEIRELPGRAFGKLYIRAYAEVLGFDPQPWIEDYDRERRLDPEAGIVPAEPEPSRPRAVEAALAQWRESKMNERRDTKEEAAPTATPQVTPEVETPAPSTERLVPPARPRFAARAWMTVLVTACALAAGTVGFLLLRDPAKRDAPAAEPLRELPALSTEAPHVEPEAPEPKPSPPPARTPQLEKTTTSELTVPEFGVGRRIVNLTVLGESDRFPPMTRVSFQTRVLGGARGELIRHVWIYERKIEQSIPLRLGGPDWRTHSSKTLSRLGAWTVEARDGSGRTLAQATFACAPDEPESP